MRWRIPRAMPAAALLSAVIAVTGSAAAYPTPALTGSTAVSRLPSATETSATSTARVPAARSAPCTMGPRLTAVQALRTCRSWVTYSPKAFGSVTAARLRADLTLLYARGFRGLVTYDVAGQLANAPKIAKSIGFQKVIAGVYNPALGVSQQVAKVARHADAVVIGNEGVSTGRYTYTQLAGWVGTVRADPRFKHLQITTSEPWILYLNQGQPWQYPQLLTLGDFAFPNFQPYFDPNPLWHANPTRAAKLVHDNWVQWFAKAAHPVVIKESWWPSALGNPANEASSASACFASPGNQAAYFTALYSYSDIYFVWGESQNVPKAVEPVSWCTGTFTDPARHWGFWSSLVPGGAKPVTKALRFGSYR